MIDYLQASIGALRAQAPRLRGVCGLMALTLLGACTVIPKGPVAPPPAPPPPTTALPTDVQRHRVALLVPMAGPNAGAGESIANAATMAILDTNAENIRITTYDTSNGAPAAAAKAVADGNQLILGPLMGSDVLAVAQTARAAHVPVISFSNDVDVAGGGVFVMGNIPDEAIERVVAYAHTSGAKRFAALIPVSAYGERASAAMMAAVHAHGGTMVGMESYDRTAGSVAAAAKRLRRHGAFDAVLIADSARVGAQAAPLLGHTQILGTELWNGEALVAHTPALNGATFAALTDARFHRFADSYKTRFGAAPYRISTLGYDSVLLTLRIARDWRQGTPFPTANLYDHGGFIGLDGAFRFRSTGVIERALEVRQAKGGAIIVVSPAPARFGD